MKTYIRILQLFLLATTLTPTLSEESKATRAVELSKWLQEQEGYEFNSKQEIRPIESNILSPTAGIFALEDIQEGEILARVPWNLIVGPSADIELSDTFNDEEFGPSKDSCSALNNLYGEIQKGASSNMSPYIDYLFSTKASLPFSFSENGKRLLLDILKTSHDEDDLPLLEKLEPPFLSEATEYCGEEASTEEGQLAAELMIQFAFQNQMIPIYDLYGHRNGRWLNTETETVPGEYFKIKALRDIKAGEPIHTSFNDCKECPKNRGHYAVPGKEYLALLGFVSYFPVEPHQANGFKQIFSVTMVSLNPFPSVGASLAKVPVLNTHGTSLELLMSLNSVTTMKLTLFSKMMAKCSGVSRKRTRLSFWIELRMENQLSCGTYRMV